MTALPEAVGNVVEEIAHPLGGSPASVADSIIIVARVSSASSS
jgi:hypothetical protein